MKKPTIGENSLPSLHNHIPKSTTTKPLKNKLKSIILHYLLSEQILSKIIILADFFLIDFKEDIIKCTQEPPTQVS